MKKTLSVILALVMVLSSVAALAEGEFVPADSYDTGVREFHGGKVTLVEAPAGGGQVTTDVYPGEEGKDYTDEKVYTYNDYTSAITSSMNWDVLSWETNEDSAIADYIISGFYTFKMNADKTGSSVVPEMAADYPVDVTAEYVGQYGVKEGETAKAWRIALNKDACFDDGTMINADDYVYSMQQQLNPKMLNRRADSWYDGTFSLVNAKNYLYAGKTTYDAITDTAENLVAAGTEVYLDMDFWGCVGALDADGNAAPQYISIADDTMYRDTSVEDEKADEAWISAKYLFETYLAAGQQYESYQPQYLKTATTAANVTWEDVGFKKIDDYTIDFILEKPVAEPAFYVPYSLAGNFLVEKSLYEACKTFYKDGAAVATEEEADTVKTDYCRSLDKSVSYGPYKLTSFELDKEYTLSRNENWYGYRDGKHLGQYQMDNLVVSVIAEHATAVLAFEKGEIDGVSLDASDMKKYASSQYISYTPQSYTTKLSFNTNYEKLVEHGTNSQLLAVDEFRKAFAFALDANAFATAYTAAGTAGYGLINYMYCYDPFTGALYRDSEAAKKALVETFDMTYGEGQDYETLDEAYEAMTGYDMEKAQALMATAADSRNDVLTTSAVLLSTVLSHLTGWDVLDGLMGVAVAAFILWSGWGLVMDTLSPLLGESPSPELVEHIEQTVMGYPGVLGMHDLMVHDYGPGRRFASVHAEIDHRIDPLIAHEILDEIERQAKKDLHVDLVIHYDPIVTDDPEVCAVRTRVLSILHAIDPRLSFHDFRMVSGPHHVNVIFDMVIPPEYADHTEQLRKQVEAQLQDGKKTYHLVVTFDTAAFNALSTEAGE